MQDKLIRLPAVIARTGLARSTIYESIRTGRFPPPVKIGPRAVAWRASEIDEWIESRPSAHPCPSTDPKGV